MRPPLACSVVVVFVLAAAAPSQADAQWYFAGYFGGTHTQPADVRIDSSELKATFAKVSFEGRPLESPQYYGWRLGRLRAPERRWGLELEFIHLKVIAKTSESVAMQGSLTPQGAPALTLTGTEPMRRYIERYAMTHGLNFLVVNLVHRRPLGPSSASSPVSLIVRAGGGVTVPHAETTILGRSQEQYQYAGLGAHAAAGLDVRLRRWLSAVAEYKITAARPRIDVAMGGSGQMTAVTHQAAIGLAFGLSR